MIEMELYSTSSDNFLNLNFTYQKDPLTKNSYGNFYDTMSRMEFLDKELKQIDKIWQHSNTRLHNQRLTSSRGKVSRQSTRPNDETSPIATRKNTVDVVTLSPRRSKKSAQNNQKQVTFSSVPERHYYAPDENSSLDRTSETSSNSPRSDMQGRQNHRSKSCQSENRKQMLFKSPIVHEISDKLDKLERQLDGFKYLQQRRNQYWVHSNSSPVPAHHTDSELTTSSPVLSIHDENTSQLSSPGFLHSSVMLEHKPVIISQQRQKSALLEDMQSYRPNRSARTKNINIIQKPLSRTVLTANLKDDSYTRNQPVATQPTKKLDHHSNLRSQKGNDQKNIAPVHYSIHPAGSQSSDKMETSYVKDKNFTHKLRLIRSRDSMREIQNLNGDIRSKIDELRQIMHSHPAE